MTPTQAKELLPVLTAYAEGKVVQFKCLFSQGQWVDYIPENEQPALLQLIYHNEPVVWRVKPSPREWWICPSCLQGYLYSEREHLGAFQCSKCSVNVVRVREVLP